MSSSDDDESLMSSSASPQPARRDPIRSGQRLTQSNTSKDLESDSSRLISSSPPPLAPPDLQAQPSDVNGVNDSLEGNSEEEESDLDDERPNKYHGSASIWRSWTEAERSLAGSLDQLRASDLSLHLYNAHALKARLRKENASAPSWASKARWLGSNDEETTSKNEAGRDFRFRPPKGWTAWPLPADIVPREGEKVGYSHDSDDERWKVTNDEVFKASEVLEEVLVGELTKMAKEKFTKRVWGDKSLLKPALSTESIGHSQSPTLLPQGSPELETGQAPDHTSFPNHAQYEPEAHLTPGVMADDQEAHRISLPTIRHVLTKLDAILMGLHHARQAYISSAGQTDSESETDRDTFPPKITRRLAKYELKPPIDSRKGPSNARRNLGIDSSSSGRKDSTSAGVHVRTKADSGVNPKSTRSRRRSSSSTPSSSSERSASTSPQPTPKKRRRPASPTSRAHNQVRKHAALGLRDWSDVLGIASLVGWDPQVVQRTAGRCSSLFAGGMSFRTLEEGNALASNKGKDKVVEYRPDLGPDPERSNLALEQKELSDRTDRSKKELSETVHTEFLCPIADCGRSKRPFTRRDNWIRHMKKVHGNAKQAIAVGFKPDDSTAGGVHNNGFLEQIPARQGWRGRDLEQRIRPTLAQRRLKRMNSPHG
ncbi:MAG: hypothetical protein M1836_000842 [Candelina mexicana]|nr:MAG: hypothetical protein M1836_000842 [Candelina mexicana]